jgi:hypothetical protein
MNASSESDSKQRISGVDWQRRLNRRERRKGRQEKKAIEWKKKQTEYIDAQKRKVMEETEL